MFVSVEAVGYLPTLLDADSSPDSLAEWARTVTPGSAVVKPLTWIQPQQLSHVGRLDAIAALESQIAWLQAAQLRMIAAVGEEPTEGGFEQQRYVREELGCALRLSAQSAEARLALAETLNGALPATLDALERGEITLPHARLLADQTVGLDAEAVSAVETRVLARAAVQSLADFRRAVKRARHAADTRKAEQRHQAALTERTVRVTPLDDGMAELWALLPADGARAVMDRLTAIAKHSCCPSDARTVDQRRADALVDLGCTSPDGSVAMRPTVQVTVALSTLLGHDDQPGELDGHGPIPATLARKLADDPTGTWRRLVTDELGQLVDAGRASYRPPAALDRYVKARDRTCRFPHCHQPATRSEVDHIIAWDDGGETNPSNLQPLCKRHHHAKHDGNWQVTRHANGDTEWVSPAGKTYLKAAARYPTGTDPDPPPF